MAKATRSHDWQRAVILLAGTVLVVVVVGALYWAQSVFIPIALAAFLTFLLNPLVASLRRWGVGRTPSVLIAVLATALLLTIIGWMATSQISNLLNELPHYTQTVKDKIRSLKQVALGSSPIVKMMADVYDEIALPLPAAIAHEGGEKEVARFWEDRPRTVVVGPQTPFWLSRIAILLNPLMESLAQLALAFVLLVFMLHRREELRNRIIRLLGQGRIVATTRFVDEAGQRISRFLLMQALVNGAFGLIIWAGLFSIGVRYALLWGFLAAIFRYLPFIGPILAAVFPAAISFAMSSTLAPTLLVIGLFLVVELVIANLVEPRLYGQSMGVSEIALLVSAAFWAFLWGPIGLVLSSPLTVCLVSLGRYTPQLEFLWHLLGDGPALDKQVSFYQRLLARDEREAEGLILETVKPGCVDGVYDAVLVPALRAAQLDRRHDLISDADLSFVLSATKKMMEVLGERMRDPRNHRPAGDCQEAVSERESRRPIPIFGCPGHGEADRIALEMLKQLLDPVSWAVELIDPNTLAAELIELIAEGKPSLICIATIPPGGLARTRYLCKRLRANFPDLRFIVCRWGSKAELLRDPGGLKKAGADTVTATLVETRQRILSLVPVLSAHQQDTGPLGRAAPSFDQGARKVCREVATTANTVAAINAADF
ncbi:MAG: AI-2E family transporter [Isosphaeraceae bacterium]